MSQDSTPEITFGEIHYPDDAARFQDTVMREVSQIIRDRSQTPASVFEALLLREAAFYPHYREFLEMLLKEEDVGRFGAQKNWIGKNPEELTETILEWLKAQEDVMKEINTRERLIEVVSGMIDKKDQQTLQMVVIRNQQKEVHSISSYMYLVFGPPETKEKGAIRSREASFPTADCHIIAAIALLDESFVLRLIDRASAKHAKPQTIGVDGDIHTARFFKIPAVSREELQKVIKTHGRTIADKLTQLGLAILDNRLERKGQHIDPFAAATDQDYALKYALACHEGIGDVVNERVILPPMILAPK